LYRDSAKIITFGTGYGAGAKALSGDKGIQGRGSTGRYVFMKTQKQAQEVIDAYWARYDVHYRWKEEEKRKVMREGEQQSLTGRKRRYFMVQDYKQLNQAINFPVSSFSHDFLLASLIELHPLLKEFDTWILWEVHDALLIEAPKQYLKEVADLVVRVMERPRFGLPIGIPVDLKYGPNWFEMEKLKL
jgi:DNA polymerase I-like protein with 3'-5' exonuclease and polymerase domains